MVPFIVVLGVLFLAGVAGAALLLWLSCQLLGARRSLAARPGEPALLVGVGYWRAVVVALLVLLGGLLPIVGVFLTGISSGSLAVDAALCLGVAFCLACACFALGLGLSAGKTAAVTAVWSVLFVAAVFGFVLVARGWLFEGFVVPTGAMADTVLGYHKHIRCPSCGHEFSVNCSGEVEPRGEFPAVPVTGCTCPNCRQVLRLVDPKRDGRPPRPGPQTDTDQAGRVIEYREIEDPGWSSGDRVFTVEGFLFQGPTAPRRFDLLVFVYPKAPLASGQKFNYVKRLVGLPGETIAIHGGNLYRLAAADGPTYDDSGVPPEQLWQIEHTHPNDEKAQDLFRAGKFQILRKSPATTLALRRLVHANDHQADDLKGKEWQRWTADGAAWKSEDGKQFRHEGGAGVDWLRYRNLLRGNGGRPTLITDFMGYNSGENLLWDPLQNRWESLQGGWNANGVNWVGDLMLECAVGVEKAEGELVLELTKGGDRFQARWDLATGTCSLVRLRVRAGKDVEEKLESKPTKLKKGSYRLRFANVDQRLLVWVDDALPFGDGVPYEADGKDGPTPGDLRPAAIGAREGAVSVKGLTLWRDTYYTRRAAVGDVDVADWGDPKAWGELGNRPVRTMLVQPGHYLFLGDNSLASSDSRDWGLVPKRLLLGKALLMYYPFARARFLR